MAMATITHEELAIVVGQQSRKVDDCHNLDGKIGNVPLGQNVRPESMENGQENCPGFCYKEGPKKTSTWLVYTRKRGRPAGPKSGKSKIEQKPAFFDRSSDASSYSRGDKDVDFEPSTPKRKRGRTTRSKYAKRKVVQKPQLVDSTSSNSDKDFEQEAAELLLSLRLGGKGTGEQAVSRQVSHGDDGRKKSTRVKGTAWDRAVELKRKLPPKGLSFVKLMMPSNVVRGFWLGLPAKSCRKHLPTHDVDVVLKDEEGKTCITKYKAENTGLSGVWVAFAKRHALKVDDALVFHLVKPEIFKVYILRENEFSTTDSDELTREEATGAKLAREDPDTDVFAAVKSPADFQIFVGGRLLVCISDRQRETYYNLCQARKAFLHEKANPDLAAEMIVETANIADGIMASSSASLQDLAVWRKRLESFERLGMDVSLMCKRVDDLIELITADPSPAEVDPQRYEEVKLERDRATKQLRAINARVSILKDALKEIDAEMEEMVQAGATKKMEQAMRKLATPW